MPRRCLTPVIPCLAVCLTVFTSTATAAPVLELGGSIEGTISPGRPEIGYRFDGEAGTVVTFSLSSDAFDTVLLLRGPDGVDLADDDDSGGNLNSRIGPLALPESGPYTLVARSLGGGGAFVLSADEAPLETMEFPGTVQGMLDVESPTRMYHFTASEGAVISVSLESSAFDATLGLYSETDATAPIATDDDGGTGFNSLIGPLTITEGGAYFIAAGSYDEGVGPFTLRAENIELDPIAFGDMRLIEFTESMQVAWLSFEADGELFANVHVDSGGTIDTQLRLRDPSNAEVAYDDDGGNGMDPELASVPVERPGRYVLELRPFAAGSTGTVRLELSRSSVDSLDDGPATVTVGPKPSRNLLRFDGRGGEPVTLHLAERRGETTQPRLYVTQEGNEIASASASGVSALSLRLVPPADGPLLVRVEDDAGVPATFEISLQR
jgi:hypothetical protein